MSAAPDPQVWGPADRPLELIARNLSTRYLAIFINGAVGLVLLPFNVSHLGPSAYGLWALTTSVTWFFGVLDLGYGGAVVKFIAAVPRPAQPHSAERNHQHRRPCVRCDWPLCFAVTVLLAWRVESLFNIDPEQARTARYVLLIVGGYLCIRFPFAVFGSIVYGISAVLPEQRGQYRHQPHRRGGECGGFECRVRSCRSRGRDHGRAGALARPLHVERVPALFRGSTFVPRCSDGRGCRRSRRSAYTCSFSTYPQS